MKKKLDCDTCVQPPKNGEKKTLKTILAGVAALLFCPCHLVFFIPLLAGTALGSVISQYTGVLTAVMMVIFGLSLWYLFRNLTSKES
jgi:mercuric ion transport protein